MTMTNRRFHFLHGLIVLRIIIIRNANNEMRTHQRIIMIRNANNEFIVRGNVKTVQYYLSARKL